MLKVAIAEDDFRIAQAQEQFLLKMKDVKVVGKALNAKETMELLERETIDLLLLDIYMPDELGAELLPKIQVCFPKVDIIMSTADGNEVCNYLVKPIKLEKFVDTIEYCKKNNQQLNRDSSVDHSLIDIYFGSLKGIDVYQKNSPSGVDPLTLQKAKEIIEDLEGGITAGEMGKKMGASRTTARRYLEYLVSINECQLKYEYGIVGRPEHKYYRI
ncbi:MAG TPA: response regulator [Bacillus sp. (in: firmicutes)]|nr:response regulator [Bacillus sp. (in: firmicutes)]